MNLKELLLKSKYRYIIICVIIFIVVFSIGAILIQSMSNEVSNRNISYTEFTVVDKYISEEGNHYYMVISDKNETFDIRSDDVGADIFNRLQIGNHYHFATQTDESKITHIIQVYNGTN